MALTDDRWIESISAGLLDGTLSPERAVERIYRETANDCGPWPPSPEVIERIRQAGRRIERVALLLIEARRGAN